MKRNATILIFAFVFAFMIFVGVMLWKQLSVSPPMFETGVAGEQNFDFVAPETNSVLDKFVNLDKSKTDLPVNLVYIKVSDNSPIPVEAKEYKYELIIPKCDLYSIFCLNRLAQSLDIKLSIVKNGEKNQIFISSFDENAASTLVLDLKKFNVHSTIKEIKQ